MIIVRPEAYRQYPVGRTRFVLVLEKELAGFFRLDGGSRYEQSAVVTADPGRTLGDILRTEVPDNCDVLVIATADALLTAPAADVGPGRTVAAIRAGQGPLALDQAGTVLTALEKTDPAEVQARADRLTSALAASGGLRLTEALTGSVAELTYDRPTWSRTDTGLFQPGAVRTAPTGRLRLATDVTGTALSGQITVKGWPVVRARSASADRRHEIYEQLTGLSHYPLVLTVDNGAVTDLKAAATGSGTAAAELERLFAEHPDHALVSGIEFGLSSGTQPLPFNTEANSAAAGKAAVSAHIVLGALPQTPYQLTLACSTSTVTAPGSTEALAGTGTESGGERPRRRMNRVTSASCGCH
ncbi:hypothetical protein IPZ58_18430 [Streptomyces roseoverticillatus]|uniref:hypothetical protein n=1 Tax=Streptomyces roseoverticillatus TaxID=66429 RepID=UPI001F36755C|nr:hypothetical protein [Streptomyces roseoverticillatus]MCF3103545.1 hypothetical protein [Streptomyces roseoverticillatus]